MEGRENGESEVVREERVGISEQHFPKGGTKGVEEGKGDAAVNRVSFRDKVLGGNSAPKRQCPDKDLLLEKLARIELEDNDPLKPKVFFEESVIRDASEVWRDALVIKLLGKQIGYVTMLNRLKALWRLKGGFDIMSAGNDHYMVKFDLPEDRSLVMEGGHG